MLTESTQWLRSYSSGLSLKALLKLSNDQLGVQRKRLICGLNSLDVFARHLTCVIRPPLTDDTASSTERLHIILHSINSAVSISIFDSSHDSEQHKANELIQQMLSQHNLCFLSTDKIIGYIDLSFLSTSSSLSCNYYGLAKEDGWLYIFTQILSSAWSIHTKFQLLVKGPETSIYELRNVWIDAERHEMIWWQCKRSQDNTEEQHSCYYCSLDLNSSTNNIDNSNTIEIKQSPSVLIWKGSGSHTLIQHCCHNNSLWILTSPTHAAITVIDLKTGQRYTHQLLRDSNSHDMRLDFLPDLSSSYQAGASGSGVKVIVCNRRLYLCYLPHSDIQRRSLRLFRIRSSSLSSASLVHASAATAAVIATCFGSKKGAAVVVYLLVLRNRMKAEIQRISIPSSYSQQHQHKSCPTIRTEIISTLRIPGQSLGDQLCFITGDYFMLSTDRNKNKVLSKPVLFAKPNNRLISLQLPAVHNHNQEKSENVLFDAFEAMYNHNKEYEDEYMLSLPSHDNVSNSGGSRRSTHSNLMQSLDLLNSITTTITTTSSSINNSGNGQSESGVIEHAGQFFFQLTRQSGCWEEKYIPSTTNSSACYINWHQQQQSVQQVLQEDSTAIRKSIWEQMISEADSWMPRQYQQFIYIDHIQLQQFAHDNDLINPISNIREGDKECECMKKVSVEEDMQDCQFLLDTLTHIDTANEEMEEQTERNSCDVIEVDLITLHPIENKEEEEGTQQKYMNHLGKIFTPEALLMILSYTLSASSASGSSSIPADHDGDDTNDNVSINEDHIPILTQFVNPIHMMILHQLLHNPHDLPVLLSSLLSAHQAIIHHQQHSQSTRQRDRSRTSASNNGESTPWSVLQSVPSQEFFYGTQPRPYQAEMVISPLPVDDRQRTEEELEDVFGLALFDHDNASHEEDNLDDSVNMSNSSVRSVSPRPIPTKQEQQLQQIREEERVFDLTDLLSFFTSVPVKAPMIQQPPVPQRQLWQAPPYIEEISGRSDSRLSQLHSNQDEHDQDDKYSEEHYFKRLIGKALLHALHLNFQAKLITATTTDESKLSFAQLFHDIDSDAQQRRVIYQLLLMADRPIAAARAMLIWHDHLAYDHLKRRIQASAEVINALTLLQQEHYRPELDVSIIEYHLQVVAQASHSAHDSHRLQEYLLGQAGRSSRLIKRLNPLFERPWSSEEIEEELEVWKQEANRGLSVKKVQQLVAMAEKMQA